ncbi:MAG TPA: SCO family protein [Vicinamibacterales bacterium]|jgi:protein SCO1/2|nr:SCO family protein [Vicinamibacterales bacterium]
MTMSRQIMGHVAAATLLAVAATACARRDAPAAPPPSDTPAGATTTAPARHDALDGASIFALDLAFTDQDGRRLSLKALGGHPMVAAMVYTSCTSVCPRVTDDMKAIEQRLSDADRARVRFVLFSLDPARDTPAAWQKFAHDHRLDPARWRLLTAADGGERDLAAVLGLKYQALDDGEIAHSAMIVVLDPAGVVRYRRTGVNQNLDEVAAALRG